MVEQAVQGIMLNDTHGAGIGIRQDGFSTHIGHDGLPPFSNLRQGLLPGNGGKLAASLWAGPLQWRNQTERRMDSPLVMSHLRAQSPACKRMGPIADDRYDAIVIDGHDEAASIRAVIRADRCTRFQSITSCSWLLGAVLLRRPA